MREPTNIQGSGQITPTSQAKQWWEYELNDKNAGAIMVQLFETLGSDSSSRTLENVTNLRLYGNKNIVGMNISQYSSLAQPFFAFQNGTINLNVIKSCIDTLVAKLSKTKIRPSFLTKRGTWKQQRQAQELTNFTAGLFYRENVFKRTPMCLRDSFIFGDGYAKVYTNPLTKRVVVERVPTDEIRVDAADGYYNDPTMTFQRKYVSRSVLLAQYPDKAEIIRQAQSEPGFNATQGRIDVVKVIEGWKKASQPGAKDGRHIIGISSGSLLDEIWTRCDFPFARISYTEAVVGYYASGMAEELVGIQREINRILLHMRDSMRLVNNPRVWIEQNSKVNKNAITNAVGDVNYYVGQPPVFQVVNGVAPENFTQLENLYRKAFEIVGVSQMTASAKNPLGSNASGEAIRNFHEIETERFMLTGQSYEQFHLDIAELMLQEMRSGVPKKEVQAFNRRDGMEIISWDKIAAKPDEYVMQVFPISALPDTPAARIQLVKEMTQAGWVDPEFAQELLDFPDTDAYATLTTSPIKLIRKNIEHMLDTDEFVPPEPFHNLEKAETLAALYYNNGQLQGIEEEKLELLRRYLRAVDGLKKKAVATQPQQQPMPAQALLESQLGAAPAAQAIPGAALPPVV